MSGMATNIDLSTFLFCRTRDKVNIFFVLGMIVFYKIHFIQQHDQALH